MDVDSDVVGGLGAQERQKFAYRGCDFSVLDVLAGVGDCDGFGSRCLWEIGFWNGRGDFLVGGDAVSGLDEGGGRVVCKVRVRDCREPSPEGQKVCGWEGRPRLEERAPNCRRKHGHGGCVLGYGRRGALSWAACLPIALVVTECRLEKVESWGRRAGWPCLGAKISNAGPQKRYRPPASRPHHAQRFYFGTP